MDGVFFVGSYFVNIYIGRPIYPFLVFYCQAGGTGKMREDMKKEIEEMAHDTAEGMLQMQLAGNVVDDLNDEFDLELGNEAVFTVFETVKEYMKLANNKEAQGK
ncbi:MAG: hypothetical protein ABEK36_04585 [Candidatus Aenigmatarchaeota archaeon]